MEESQVFRFGSFCLDAGARVLAHRGRRVRLRGKVFDLLELLASCEGRVVGKAALRDALWPGVAVHENNIAVTVRSLRRALQEHEPAIEWIETVPGRGYRLAPSAAATEAARPPLAPRPNADGDAPAGGLARWGGPGPAPFVAREAELERLGALWAGARAGAGRVVFVSGEPGIGKSALLGEFLARALASAPLALLLRGQCIPLFGLAEPHLPLREALGDGLQGSGRSELRQALERHAPGWCARLPPALVGEDAGREAWPGAHAGAHELTEALRAAAARRPLLLVLEDLHWADASSVDVLRWLSARVDGSALLVVGTYRPADVRAERHPLGALLDDLAARGQHLELALGPWQLADLERYLAARSGSPALAAALARPIAQRSEGLPLFAVRLIESLLERELVRRGATGGLELALPVAALELRAPASVAAMIEGQLDRLPAGARSLLEVACVDGSEFGTALASELLGAAPARVEAALQPLASAHGLLERLGEASGELGAPLDVRYRFRHVLYRDHLYARLGSHRRAELHLAIARALVGSGASAGRIAFHFERGRDVSRAVAYWTEAGDAADRGFAKLEALECYQRAAALLDALPAGERALRRLVLEHGRGWAAYGLSRAEAARQHFAEFARLARELLEAPAAEREPALALAREYFSRPWSDVVMRRPAGIFPRTGSADVGSELLAEALHCCCHVASAAGDTRALRERARALARVAQGSRSGPRRAEALAWLGVYALRAGRAQQARARLDAALALAQALDHERALRVALGQRAWLHRAQAELEPARAAYEELWRRVPDASTAAAVLSELGATLAASGRAGAALDAYARADALRRRVDPAAPSLHGALLRELGQLAAARELDRVASARLRGRAEPLACARLLASLALTCCREGDLGAAHEPLREAEAIAAAERDDGRRAGAATPAGCSWQLGPLWAARCELAAASGDLSRLGQVARRWLRSARARRDGEGVKAAGFWLGVAAARAGDVAHGVEVLRRALDATRAQPLPLVDWRCQALLAELAGLAGDDEEAARAREEAARQVGAVAGSLDDAIARRCFEQMVEHELSGGLAARCGMTSRCGTTMSPQRAAG